MNNFFKNLLKLLLILLSSLNYIKCRELSVEVNPNCSTQCDDRRKPVYLVHIESKGDQDIIHYLWSSITCIPPTLLIVETDLTSKLDIKWERLLKDVCNQKEDLKNVISFSGKVTNSIGFQFSRLFFFNDNNKKGSYDGSQNIIEFKWSDFVWQNTRGDLNQKGGDRVQLTFQNNKTEEAVGLFNGTIAFDLRVDKSDGRSEELPHLAFTQKSVSLQISVKDVLTEKHFKGLNETDRPRLMSEIFLMTGGQTNKKFPDFESITSIDDEYTPGVFRRIVLDLKNGDKEVKNSFLSWKPIAYNSEERIIANTLDVIHDKVETLNSSELSQNNSRIFESYFDVEKDSKLKFMLTFGAADDDTYYTEKKRISAFSLVVGVDSAPDEELSFLVKMIIVVGFGLPLIVMIVSALYLIVRKIRKRKFNDLLLSRSQQTLND